MNIVNIHVALAFAMLAAGAVSGGEEIVIARRGAPSACTITVPDAPSPCLKHAAEELAKYVKAMTGVALPVAESAKARGPKIRLVSGVALGRDSFRFGTDGDDFVIAGDDDRAVLFGVYDFLENDCGCDWITYDQEIVPARDAITVPRGLERLRRPAFRIRENSFADVCQRPDFAAKLKLNGYLFARKYGWKDIHGGKPAEQFDSWLGKCHTFMHLLPPKRYFKAHPEYYAEVDGRRRGEGRVQLCLTNPDVLRIVTSNLLRRIEQKYPDVKIFGVSQSDCWDYCRCKECAAVDAREESHAGSNIEFVNAVADAVAKKYPDVIIETLAYEYTRKPPKNVKPRPNVMICLCTDTCDFSRPLRETRFRFRGENDFVEDLKAWCAISRRVHIWDYTMNFRYKLHAFPNIYSLKPNLETFLDCGVTEVYEEGCSPSVHQAGVALKSYLIGHLLWDPRQPLEPLLDRFYAGYYGAAAPWMRRYMEELHAMSRERDERKYPLMMWGVVDSPALKTEFFERGAEYLAKAAEAVKDDPVRSRNVRWEMNANDYTRIMRANDICDYVLMRSGEYPVTPHLKELQSAARRILADWKAVPLSGKLSEENGVIAASTNRMARYASFDPAKARASLCVHVPAAALHGNLDDGAARLLFSDILAETGCVYRISARIKADVRPDARPDDEAFRMWVKNNPKTGRIYKVKDLKPGADGYGWYELRSTTAMDPAAFYIIEKGKKGGVVALTLDTVRVAFADVPTAADSSTANRQPATARCVKASDFGWNAVNATAALRAAIASGADKIVIDRQSGDWNVEPISLRCSNQEIVVADGVTVRALKGAFKRIGECLFNIPRGVSNVVLRGEGTATIAMNKRDYQNPEAYSFSEWRHAISICGGNDVTVRDLTILSSGGDGVYVRDAARNVRLDRLVCRDHHRQGISVISAVNLLVTNCRFEETSGTPPQCGVDIEPNTPKDRLENVVFEDCAFVGNASSGILMYLAQLDDTTAPISVAFRRCESVGNRNCGIRVTCVGQGMRAVRGTVTFEDCKVSGNALHALAVTSKRSDALDITVRNCILDGRESAAETIRFDNRTFLADFGGITFDGVRVLPGKGKTLVFDGAAGTGIAGVMAGAFEIAGEAGRTETVSLADFAGKYPPNPELLRALLSFGTKIPEFRSLKPVDGAKPLEKPSSTGWMRGKFTFVQYIPAAGDYPVTFRTRRINAKRAVLAKIEVRDAVGTYLDAFSVGDVKTVTNVIHATGAGIRRFEVNIIGGIAAVDSVWPGHGVQADGYVAMFGGRNRQWYFTVPADAENVRVQIRPDEPCSARLLRPDGSVAAEFPYGVALTILETKRTKTATPETWCLHFPKVTEDAAFRIGSPSQPFASPCAAAVLQ